MLLWVNYMSRLFLHQCIQKLGRILAIFAVQPMNFVLGEFVIAPTALYIVHLLKIHCHSVSLGELLQIQHVDCSSIVLFAFQ